jgi:hypothetical protein
MRMRNRWVIGVRCSVFGVGMVCLVLGCQRVVDLVDRVDLGDAVQPVPAETTTTTVPAVEAGLADEMDLSQVVWHEADIRGWRIGADLKAYVKGSQLRLETDLLKGAQEIGSGGTSGNPWVIALCRDGKWHAATWEWISYSRQSRDLWKLLDAGHINVSAFDGVEKGPGTVVYVAVAGLSRARERNLEARTPFRKVMLP